jgi:hypothetical protein
VEVTLGIIMRTINKEFVSKLNDLTCEGKTEEFNEAMKSLTEEEKKEVKSLYYANKEEFIKKYFDSIIEEDLSEHGVFKIGDKVEIDFFKANEITKKAEDCEIIGTISALKKLIRPCGEVSISLEVSTSNEGRICSGPFEKLKPRHI